MLFKNPKSLFTGPLVGPKNTNQYFDGLVHFFLSGLTNLKCTRPTYPTQMPPYAVMPHATIRGIVVMAIDATNNIYENVVLADDNFSIELESSVDGTSHDGSERSNRYTANNINGNNNADREMIMSAIPIVDGERIVL